MPSGRYGRRHQRIRAALAREVSRLAPCPRCGHPLGPGDIALDHADDGLSYIGFSHASPCPVCGKRCNQVAGGIASALRAGRKLRQRTCVVDGKPYTAKDSKQLTCGSRECESALRAATKARVSLPPPQPSNARPW